MNTQIPDTLRVIVVQQPAKSATIDYTSPWPWVVVCVVMIVLAVIVYRLWRRFKNSRPKSYKLDIGGFSVEGDLSYYTAEQELAWKIYVELATRVSGNTLMDGQGILRESLDSLYKVFGVLRDLLKDSGAQMARSLRKGEKFTVATLLLKVMNEQLRPFLSKWHPRLEAHEKTSKENQSQSVHEQVWSEAQEFREALQTLQIGLQQYIKALHEIAQGK